MQSFHMSLHVVREARGPSCNNAESMAAQLTDLATLAQEAFVVLTLNTKYQVIDRHLITLGILDASLVHPREVFRAAITDSAAAIVIAHNHPSGNPTPSGEDISVTRKLVAAGKLLEIDVLDHIIIGRGETPYTSLRGTGLIDFA